MPSNQVSLNINGGADIKISGNDSDGLGTHEYDLTPHLPSIFATAGSRYLFVNMISLRHWNGDGIGSTPVTRYLGRNVYMYCFSRTCAAAGQSGERSTSLNYSSDLTLATLYPSGFQLTFFPFFRCTGPTTAEQVLPTVANINDLYNFSGGLKFGFEISYKLGNNTLAKKYVGVSATALSSINAVSGRTTLPPVVNPSDGEPLGKNSSSDWGVSLNTNLTLSEYVSNGIDVVSPTFAQIGLPTSAGTSGSTLLVQDRNINVAPILYYGTITNFGAPTGGWSYVLNPDTGFPVVGYLDVISETNSTTLTTIQIPSVLSPDTMTVSSPYASIGENVDESGVKDTSIKVVTSPSS